MHVCSEASVPDVESLRFECCGERLQNRNSRFRSGGGHERGTAPLPNVGEERELGDGENGPADIGDAAVHLAVVIGEDAHPCDLRRGRDPVRGRVPSGDADEHEETGSDRTRLLPVDRHPCPDDSLQDDTHRSSLFVETRTVHPSGGTAPTLAAMLREIPWSLVRGFLMGSADIVPGVSGGTIALVLGIYERLIASVRAGSSALGSFLRFDFSGGVAWLKRVDWAFIVPLGAGIGLAIIALSHLLERLLREQAVLMAAMFLGLVAGSAIIAWRLLTERDLRRVLVIVGVGLVVFVLLGLREDTSSDTATQLADPALWAFFASGAVAIVAMILPGISGSFILVTLGMYGPLLSAVTSRDLISLVVFMVGAVIGLALFSQVLHRALRDHYNTVMAVLIGLMLGSLRVLWPWPRGVDSTALESPSSDLAGAIALAVAAFAVVLVIEAVGRRFGHHTIDDEVEELTAD